VTSAGFESIRVDLDPPVATITLDRPQALNAITPQMLAELAAALEWAGHEPSIVVVVVIDLIRSLNAVVIAKINGPCFTGALELALACDIVLAAEEAVLGDTHAKWGLRPSWGMSQRLPWLVGAARARYLSYVAATFTGRQAADWGLAALACPRSALDAAAAEVAAGLAYEATTDYSIDDTEARIARFR